MSAMNGMSAQILDVFLTDEKLQKGLLESSQERRLLEGYQAPTEFIGRARPDFKRRMFVHKPSLSRGIRSFSTVCNLILGFCGLVLGQAIADPAFVQATSTQTSSGTSHVLAFGSNVTAGSRLFVFTRGETNAVNITACSDDVNGSWTSVTSEQVVSGGFYTNMYTLASAGAGATTVTCTSGSAMAIRMIIAEYSGSETLVTSGATRLASADPQTCGNVTATASGQLVIGSWASNVNSVSIAPNNAETERQEIGTRLQLEEKATTGSGSYALTWNLGQAADGACLQAIVETASGSPPSFSSGPTVSAQTDTTYTLSYTPNQSTTFYAVACAKDSTAPSVAQVKAGDCTGDVDALAAVNEAVTGADTTDLGGSLTFPLYDLYAVLSDAGGDSSLATLADEQLDPAGGFSRVILASIGSGSPCESFNTATDPDLVAGDIADYPSATSPGAYAFTVGTDCQASYTGDDSRQSALNWKLYDVSAAGIHADDIDFWANNQAPTCIGPFAQVIKTDEAMTNIVIANDTGSLCEDAESDELTTTLTVGTLPTGTSLSGTGNGTLGGTPTVENESGVLLTFTVTDIAGDTATQDIDKLYPITSWTLPDCTTTPLDAASCAGTIEALTIESVTVSSTYECSTTVDPNYVISQNPAAMAEIAPFSTVDLVVAKTCGGGGRLRLNLDLRL